MAELAKLPLRLAAVAEGAGLPEVVGRTPKLGCGARHGRPLATAVLQAIERGNVVVEEAPRLSLAG